MGALLTSSLDIAENAALQVMASEIASPIWTALNDNDVSLKQFEILELDQSTRSL